MSHLGIISQDMAFIHDRNYIHIYLPYTCNVFILEKGIKGALLPVLHLLAPASRSQLDDQYTIPHKPWVLGSIVLGIVGFLAG